MKTLAKNWLVILLLLFVMAIAMAIYAKKNRERKEDEVRQIHDMLDSNIGIDGTDIKMLIQGTATANGFDALPVAQAIYKAKSWYNDDEEAVYAAFAGKNKAQIAAIYKIFVGHYGQDLDEFLKSFLDIDTEYANVLRIIRQAA